MPNVDLLIPLRGNRRPAKVLIAGGGVGAMEAALALRDLAGDLVAVELCAPSREFVYRLFSVGEPYATASILRYDLGYLAERCGVSFRPGGIVAVDPEAGEVVARDGEGIAYDYLVLAPGARMLGGVPGAVTFWGVADEGGVGAVVQSLRRGALRSVVFTMPAGSSWALPLYGLALLAAAVLAKSGIEDAKLSVVTPEDAPLEIFGRPAAEQMSQLLAERGIEVVGGALPVGFEDGRLRIVPGEPIETEAVVSLPRIEGRRIDGVPHDDDGFVPTDEHSRVVGTERVFAVGDVTAFPLKQGGVATQQADAAAAAIAADVGGELEPAPFDPVLRGVPWTDEERDGKIVGRYLSPFLGRLSAEGGDEGPIVAPIVQR